MLEVGIGNTATFAAVATAGGIFIYDNDKLFKEKRPEVPVYRMTEGDAYASLEPPTGLDISSADAVFVTAKGDRHILRLSADYKHLWHYTPNKEKLPDGNFAYSPTMCSWGGERLDVFVVSSDNLQLYHGYEDKPGAWQGWFGVPQLPNGLKSAPAAVSWGSGRIDIVAQGADQAVWHLCFDLALGGWQSWRPLGGTVTAAPTICSLKPNRLDVFARGQDYRVWHQYFENQKWHNPADPTKPGWHDEVGAPPGDNLLSHPVAVTKNNKDIYVLCAAPEGAVGGRPAFWHSLWNGSKWSRWIPTRAPYNN